MTFRSLLVGAIQLAAWLAVIVLIVVTIVPPTVRPVSHFPSLVEHFAAFFLAGLLNHLGYPRRLVVSLIIAIAFSAGIELLQIPLHGRHARLIDFVVDAMAACAGTLVGFLLVRAGLGPTRANAPERPRPKICGPDDRTRLRLQAERQRDHPGSLPSVARLSDGPRRSDL